ncbi:MAG: sugar phosphate isomerase/epimerase, partial [Eubacterium sp.]|nr:sugar phosphate isomerase/epimerase [Eubacterium sp.]
MNDAAIMGFDGVEIYHVSEAQDLTDRGGPFHTYAVQSTYRELREKGLTIACFDSSIDIACAGEADMEVLRAQMRLAADLRAPYVAVWASGEDAESAEGTLAALIPLAEELGVTVLIKTCGMYASTERLRDLLDRFACDQIAVLWDVHHPYRDCGESPAQTITNLGAYVKHVHMRDSFGPDAFELIGEGDFPVGEVMDALESVDYAGFVSLEWKPQWLPELTDREIILPHFVNFMQQFRRSRSRQNGLYYNHDGTGRYIWKKDELIDLTFPQVLDALAREFPDQYCFKYMTLNYT